MNMHQVLTKTANDFLHCMKESFPSTITRPDYDVPSCFNELNENVTNEYLEDIFHRRLDNVFAAKNGFSELLGSSNEYEELDEKEKEAWVGSVKNIGSFVALIRATGPTLNTFEQIALLTKSKFAPNAEGEQKSPLDAAFSLFGDAKVRQLLLNAIDNPRTLSDIISKSGPLLSAMTFGGSSGNSSNSSNGTGSATSHPMPPVQEEEAPASPCFPPEEISEAQTSIQGIGGQEEEREAETSEQEQDVDGTCQQEEEEEEEEEEKLASKLFQQEKQKLEQLRKKLFASSQSQSKESIMENLGAMLAKMSNDEEGMSSLFNSVKTTLEGDNLPIEVASIGSLLKSTPFTANLLQQCPVLQQTLDTLSTSTNPKPKEDHSSDLPKTPLPATPLPLTDDRMEANPTLSILPLERQASESLHEEDDVL